MTAILPSITSKDFAKFLPLSKPAMGILICSYQDNHPIFQQIEFCRKKVKNKWLIKDSVLFDETKLQESGAFANVFGSCDSSNKVLNQIPREGLASIFNKPKFHVNGYPNFLLNSPQNLVYYLVYVQTKADTTSVGGPISVLRFSNTIIKWEYNELKCP